MPEKTERIVPEDVNDNHPTFYADIHDVVEDVFKAADMEVHPFLVGWYNELVGPKFALDYPSNTVAVVVISGPDVFEKAVIPYLKSEVDKNVNFATSDPLDAAMKHYFKLFAQELQKRGYSSQIFHDFDLHPNRKPKVLVQTAAHVAGAVEYVFKSRLTSPEYAKEKLFGVAVHPRYGGWFAIRGIIILEDVQHDLKRPFPLELFQDESRIALILREFTYNWKSNVWRDVILPVGGKIYSQAFQDYLETAPDERWKFIQERGYFRQPS